MSTNEQQLMMNPATGSVDTLENWKAEFRAAQADEPGLTWEAWGGATLVAVDADE